MLTTNLPDTVRQSNTEEAVSVIHAPESFANWVRRLQSPSFDARGSSH